MLLTEDQIARAIKYNKGQIQQGDLTEKKIQHLLALGTAYFQSENGLSVDGEAGPKTQAALDNVVPPEMPSGLPFGKGMFIRSLAHTGSTAQEAVDWATYHDLSWVIIQRISQYEDKESKLLNGTKLPAYAAAFQEAGIQVWLWGWPTPSKNDEFVRVMYEAVEATKARGIIIDPEAPWIGTKGLASDLMSKLLVESKKAGTLVGMTSYGSPWYFKTFPWAEFNSAHFGMPQVYDAQNDQTEDYPTRSLNAWEEQGYRILLPISAGYNKTPEQMEDILRRTPTPVGAIAWWDWFNLNQSQERWRVIYEYDVPSNRFGLRQKS